MIKGQQHWKFTWSRDAILAAFLLLLTVLSLHGAVDLFAYALLAETTAESLGIYALSRSINAGISVFQSTQFGVGITVQLGELLDPINDAVERLSAIMVWAIGSLLLQRLVLEVTSTAIFEWSFFCIGVATSALLLVSAWHRCRELVRIRLHVTESGLNRCRGLLIRVFVVAAIIRFIVPVFVITSSLASEMFVGATVQEQRDRLSAFSADIGVDPGLPLVTDEDLESQRAETSAKLDDLEDSLAQHRRETQHLDDQIRKLREAVGWWRSRAPEFLGGVPPSKELSEAMATREQIGDALEGILQRQIERGRQDLQCIERRLAGDTCDSLFDKFTAAGKTRYAQMLTIVDKSSRMVTSIARLAIAIAVKNILFPIVFLMIALKYGLPFIRYAVRKSYAWERNLKELPNSLRQLD